MLRLLCAALLRCKVGSHKLFRILSAQLGPILRLHMNAIFFHFSCVSICNICLGNTVPSSHMHYQFPEHRKGRFPNRAKGKNFQLRFCFININFVASETKRRGKGERKANNSFVCLLRNAKRHFII